MCQQSDSQQHSLTAQGCVSGQIHSSGTGVCQQSDSQQRYRGVSAVRFTAAQPNGTGVCQQSDSQQRHRSVSAVRFTAAQPNGFFSKCARTDKGQLKPSVTSTATVGYSTQLHQLHSLCHDLIADISPRSFG